MQQGGAIGRARRRPTSIGRLVLFVAVGVAGLGGRALADDCFAEGMRLSNEGAVEAAADAFKAARSRAECDDPLLLLNEAIAAQTVAESTQQSGWACRAAVLFEKFGQAWDEPTLKSRADKGIKSMASLCAAAAPPVAAAPVAPPSEPPPPVEVAKTPEPETPPEPSPTPAVSAPVEVDGGLSGRSAAALSLLVGGLVTGGAGAFFLIRADSHFDDANAAHARYTAARTPDVAEAAWNEVEDAHGRGKTERWLGYGLVGLGGAMGLAALFVAVSGDDEAPEGVGLVPGPHGAYATWTASW